MGFPGFTSMPKTQAENKINKQMRKQNLIHESSIFPTNFRQHNLDKLHKSSYQKYVQYAHTIKAGEKKWKKANPRKTFP